MKSCIFFQGIFEKSFPGLSLPIGQMILPRNFFRRSVYQQNEKVIISWILQGF